MYGNVKLLLIHDKDKKKFSSINLVIQKKVYKIVNLGVHGWPSWLSIWFWLRS